MPNDDLKTGDHRGTHSYKGGRGIAERTLPKREGPETNVRPESAGVREVVAGRLYRAQGIDIDKPGFTQRGLPDEYSKVVDAYIRAPGSTIRITGSESPSVKKGAPGLPERRAQATRAALLAKGIPETAIEVAPGSPPSKEDPRYVSAQRKAQMRGATIEVVPPKKSSPRQGFTDG